MIGMEELRRLYIAESEQKTSRLRNALAHADDGAPDHIDELYRLFHNMAGSGGSYGYPYVSELAEKAKSILRPLQSRNKEITPEASDDIRNLIDILESYFKKAIISKGESLPEDMLESTFAEEPFYKLPVIDREETRLVPGKALAVDSDEASLRLINWSMSRENIEVQRARDGIEAMKMLRADRPDILITEINIEGINGLELIKKVKKDLATRLMPVLVVSHKTSMEKRIEGLKAGADHYLTKPFHPLELLAIVKAEMEKSRMVQEMVIYDTLTGAYTRRYIFERLREETRRHQRNVEPLCLAIIDLDHFKNLNDTYGHLAGDEILRRLIAFLKKQLRSSDVLGRYGGEEFIILMPHTTKPNAIQVLDRIREAWGSTPQRLGIKVEPVTVTFSVGVSVMDKPGLQAEDLIFRADRALYAAKDQGRNKVFGEGV